MTNSISPEDRTLIERTRKVNKALSIFVFALQEHSNIPTESQVGITEMLVALADTIRVRAAKNDVELLLDGAVLPLQIEAPRQRADTEH